MKRNKKLNTLLPWLTLGSSALVLTVPLSVLSCGTTTEKLHADELVKTDEEKKQLSNAEIVKFYLQSLNKIQERANNLLSTAKKEVNKNAAKFILDGNEKDGGKIIGVNNLLKQLKEFETKTKNNELTSTAEFNQKMTEIETLAGDDDNKLNKELNKLFQDPKHKTKKELNDFISNLDEEIKIMIASLESTFDQENISKGQLQTVIDKKIYARTVNAIKTYDGNDYDGSSSFGSEVSQASYIQTGLKLFRVQALNAQVIKEELQKVPGEAKPQQVTIIKYPSFWKYRLEAADAIVLTLKDGTTEVFDTDEVDELPKMDGIKKYNEIYQQHFSSNAKSINSKNFFEKLKKATKMQFTIRSYSWVDKNGNETEYKTNAKDFYYSWMRTNLHAQATRLQSSLPLNEALYDVRKKINDDFSQQSQQYDAKFGEIDKKIDDIVNMLKSDENITEDVRKQKETELTSLTKEKANLEKDLASVKQKYDQDIQANIEAIEKQEAYQLENLVQKHMPSGSELFTKKDKYPNAYLFDLFSVNKEALFNEESFITKISSNEQKVKGRDAVTFEAVKGQNALFGQWLDFLAKGSLFYAAPSQFIQKQLDDKTFSIQPQGANISSEDLSKLKELFNKEEFLKSDAAKFGQYWYGLGLDNTLFAGPYYTKGVESLVEKFVKNKHYFDKEWVNSPETLEGYEIKYQAAPVDVKVFDTQQWQAYEEGTVSEVPFSSLNQTDRNTVLNDKQNKYGLKKRQSLIKDRLIARIVQEIAPVPIGSSSNLKYLFNDGYAKLMWGATTEQISKGEMKSFETYAAGTGLRFRTLIAAAINWAKQIDDQTNGQSKPYIARVAPDAKIDGMDQLDAEIKTPRDAYDDLNSLFALNSDLDKINLGTAGKEVSPTEYAEKAKKETNENEQYKGVGFAEIQKEMKILLDKFFEDNKDLFEEKKVTTIEYKVFYPYINISAHIKEAVKKVIKTINELDSRIKLDLQAPTDSNTFYNSFKTTASAFVGWSYDLQSIASGFDGLSWNTNLLPLLYTIANNSATYQKLEKSFPQLMKASKEFKTWLDAKIASKDLIFNPTVTPEKWEQIVIKHSSEAYVYIQNEQDKVQATDPFTVSAQWWIHYTTDKTNKDLISLANEFTNFLSPQVADGKVEIAKLGFTNYLSQKGYVAPIQEDGIVRYADYKLNKNN
ncbi:OppA family ABC transporter substrate-binding lipoprotein [Mycoplasma phocoenae]|uniref:Lipoprotein n=1 Tax=Mycoplasma phocoenae TaxID=754517 RepID=A0A858U7Z7_9MOLU|nr:OmpH family outer membrane protein [Mycoplasma phocoenae]QJG66856.1 hypothetical protein HGG69_00750 [Mycoplasma phocoenae]